MSSSPAEPFWVLYAREHIDVEGESRKKENGNAAATTSQRQRKRTKPHKRFKLPKTTPTTFEFERPRRSDLAAAEAGNSGNPRDYGIQAELALSVEPPLLVRGPNLKSFLRALGSAVQLESENSLRIVRTQAKPFLVFISASSDNLLTKIQDVIARGNFAGKQHCLSLVVGDQEKLVTFHSLKKGASVHSSSAPQGSRSSAKRTLRIVTLSPRDKKLLAAAFKSCCHFYGDSSTLMADGVLQALRRVHGGGMQLGFSTALPTMLSLRRWYRSAKLPHDAKLDLKAFLQVAAVAYSEADHERKRLSSTTASRASRHRSGGVPHRGDGGSGSDPSGGSSRTRDRLIRYSDKTAMLKKNRPPKFLPTTKVLARYKGRTRWFPGTIEMAFFSEKKQAYVYNILYNDGETEKLVPEDLVKEGVSYVLPIYVSRNCSAVLFWNMKWVVYLRFFHNFCCAGMCLRCHCTQLARE